MFHGLKGPRSEFDAIWHALASMKRLKEFYLNYCHSTVTGSSNLDDLAYGNTQREVIDSLLNALSEIESLKDAQLYDMQPSRTPGSNLERLCIKRIPEGRRSDIPFGVSMSGLEISSTFIESMLGKDSRLTQLELRDIESTKVSQEMMAVCLKSNERLKELRMTSSDGDSSMAIESGLKILETLKDDNHSLEALQLFVECDEHLQYSSSLTGAVQNTGYLKELHLDLADTNAAGRLVSVSSLLRGLSENKSLSAFHLDLGPIDARTLLSEYTVKFNKCLRMGLERNHYMNELTVTVVVTEGSLFGRVCLIQLSPDVTFWLKLNRAGRRCLQRNL